MTVFQFILLAVAGLAAGALNAVAGGGSFFTFAALVATGMPTLDANATSAAALTPANFATVLAYRKEVRTYIHEMIPFVVIGAVGAILGAWLLIWLGDGGFRPLVPWLLLFATIMFAFSRPIRTFIVSWADDRSLVTLVTAYTIMTVVSIYGGFFGAGMGIIMLAALAILEGGDFHKANATKAVVALLIQTMSAALLVVGGLVHWPHALITMVASVIGGYLGVGIARRVPERIIRVMVVTVGAALTVIFFVR